MEEDINEKRLTALYAKTTRDVFLQVNEKRIKREDLVTILPIQEQYVVFYYE
jgi:hypothetical protein